MMKKATLADVAALAEVSKATVSRYFCLLYTSDAADD